MGIYVPFLGCNDGFGINMTTNLSKHKLEIQTSYYVLINPNLKSFFPWGSVTELLMVKLYYLILTLE